MKRAMLIASWEFLPDSGIEPLRFPLNDIEAMEGILNTEDFGFEVEKLTNPTSSLALEKLGRWVTKADYDDLVLIYFSGHGRLSRARELFLACANTESGNLIPTSIKYAQLTDLIHERSLQKVIVILDCCYAGRALDGGRGDIRGATDDQVRAAVDVEGSGIFFLGASGRNQTAEEREIDGHGRLTKQILVGLSSGDADIEKDGDITARELARYVKQRLRSENAEQEPIEGGAYHGELVLGSNRRKVLTAAVVAIRARVEVDKRSFKKETFRAIEDYLDLIEASTAGLPAILEDRKYLVLKRYADNTAGIEEVVQEFWPASALGRTREPDSAVTPPKVYDDLAPAERPSVGPSDWRVELLERGSRRFVIAISGRGEDHKLKYASKQYTFWDTVRLDGIWLRIVSFPGLQTVKFRIGKHPTKFVLTFDVSVLGTVSAITLKADDMHLLENC